MSDEERPLVTVVMPARDEEAHITHALRAIAEQDYPHARMQVIVVDGASTDSTATVATDVLRAFDYMDAKVIPNPEGTTPSNLNRGLAEASGKYICRVDARSIIPPQYVRRCTELLADPSRVAVGGRQVAIAPSPSTAARGIARALNNRWSMGVARYRRGATSGSADTVYLGAFRTSELREIGGWDLRLHTNQDFDLNRRLSQRGTIWFEASLEVGYRGRTNLPALWRQYVRFGSWKVEYWRLTGERPRFRQWIALVGPPAVTLSVAAWSLGHPSRLRRVLVGLGAIAGTVAAVDEWGATDEEHPPAAVRLTSLAAIATVVGGWSWGALRMLGKRLAR